VGQIRWAWVLVTVVAALLVRVPAVSTLTMDADEPIYLAAATQQAQAIATRDIQVLLAPPLNTEHPALVKLMYGVGMMGLGDEPSLVARLAVMRSMSLIAGVGTVALLGGLNPVAGLALATHTIHAKYSAQGYLDALPLLWMSLAMLIGWRYRARPETWLILVAASCWGAAIAGKWIHGLPGLVLIAVIPGFASKLRFGLMAAGAAWFLDPSMWLNPWSRLVEMTHAHAEYAAHIAPKSGVLTPLLTLAEGGPSHWHPEVFPISLDGLWLALGLVGLILSWRDSFSKFIAAWFALPALFLMAWDTRWPQHTMVLVVPVCLGVGRLAAELFSCASHRSEPSGSPPPASA